MSYHVFVINAESGKSTLCEYPASYRPQRFSSLSYCIRNIQNNGMGLGILHSTFIVKCTDYFPDPAKIDVNVIMLSHNISMVFLLMIFWVLPLRLLKLVSNPSHLLVLSVFWRKGWGGGNIKDALCNIMVTTPCSWYLFRSICYIVKW